MVGGKKPKCVRRISLQSGTRRQCRNTGVLEYAGMHYCRTHHPPTVETREEARHRKAQKAHDDWLAKRAAVEELSRLSDDALKFECEQRGWRVMVANDLQPKKTED